MSVETNGTQSGAVTETASARAFGSRNTSRNGDAIGSRNDLAEMSLERLEARLAVLDGALTGSATRRSSARPPTGPGPDRQRDPPKPREARTRACEAAHHGRACGRCGGAFAAGAVVYLAGLGLGRKGQLWQAPVCEGCAPGYMRRGHPADVVAGSCATCSRPLVWRLTGRDLYRFRRFCSARCEWTHHNGARNARAAAEREKVCEACGEAFTASRRDARMCSPACKQKAYRRRKGVA